MLITDVIRRFEQVEPPRFRTAPGAGGDPVTTRGDHDLNPELYEPGQSLRDAAVLVPLVVRANELTVLLTKRTDHLHHHPGQISFPGGRIDPGDASPEDAALRETEEEIGLGRDLFRLLGRLDTYVVRTGFSVVPVVGLIEPPFEVALDEFEVAEVFEVPLSFVLDPANKQRHSRMFKGKERHFFVYPYQDYYIWGATAGMLGNLAEVLTTNGEGG